MTTNAMNPSNWKRREILSLTGALASGAFGLRAAEDSEKLRVAVIGHTGRGDYGHGIDKVWLQIPETEIVAVADPVESGRAKAIERLSLKAEAGFESYQEMLNQVKPNIVAIGPRHIDQHRDFAVASAQAGAKGIYIEKPFVRDLAEADEVVAACEKSGTRLAIAHRNRY
ncbi:MAG: Gfo/Idh/MocA family oxidoreductase, partial [Verrucomicrobiae bacterium]|nr:Gfo/Idh/MocA family oxidoreductase [Verrucomicrobiae bacterium]